MQTLATKFVIGVGVVGAVAMSYGLVQQLIKSATLQTLNASTVSVEQALMVAEGAIAECKKNNDIVTVAVVDSAGDVRFILRGDGASQADVEAARRKAYTARTFRSATSDWIERTSEEAVDEKGEKRDLIGQRFLENTIAEAGGMPLIWHGEAIGAVGVKGAKAGGTADEACAKAGVAAIADQLL